MAEARLLTQAERAAVPGAQAAVLSLTQRLPAVIAGAKEIAASSVHGVHGRRRAGSGETFWQFRPFHSGEAASRVDWRRSGRDERLYVREREWEAAHTVWLWMDQSRSMAFQSQLAMQSKVERALLLGLASADLLMRGGERAGLIGLSKPLSARNIVDRFAEILLAEARGGAEPDDLPPPVALGARSRAILISDFLVAPEMLAQRLQILTAHGAAGQLLMIADPVEETFPYEGHIELQDVDSSAILHIGNARAWRLDYGHRLAAHRAAIADIARKYRFSLLIHRTDRPASQALLTLRSHLEAGQNGAGV